jgi:L-threonylcarbamoyladenylate synthase
MSLSQETIVAVEDAAERLRRGGLVAFPTETVYGLGADAANPEAVARIFAVKGRPAHHPLIVHLGEIAALDRWATAIPPAAWLLAERFWPGPLTLVLRRRPTVSDLVTGGQDTVGLRVPAHPLALALLAAFGGGIAAPSANRFGRLSPTTAEHVRAELGEHVDLILDGGPCQVGIESTIVDLSGKTPRLLRPGIISPEALAEVLGEVPSPASAGRDVPRAPGTLSSHYAPRTPLELIAAEALESKVHEYLERGERIGVLARRHSPTSISCPWQPMPAEAADYARELYARLRALDALGLDRLVVERPPEEPSWQAVRDRLERAAAHR